MDKLFRTNLSKTLEAGYLRVGTQLLYGLLPFLVAIASVL